MKTNYFLFFSLFFSAYSFGQNVDIPDVNFKNYLLNNSSINTNGDNEIQLSEAENYSGTISVYNDNISDLTGVEAFTAITGLRCGNNNLTSLDVSKNTLLTALHFDDNNIISIDLSNNTLLEELSCEHNQLNSLVLPNTSTLQKIECNNNNLTALNTSINTGLEFLKCDENLITNLNLSNNTNLERVYCDDNEIEDLTLPVTTSLTYLDCRNNKMPILDVSGNLNLAQLYCQSNYTRCIKVANKNAADNNSDWYKSDLANYDEVCTLPEVVNIPDNNFLQALIKEDIDKNEDGQIDENEAKVVTRLSVSNEFITDLTGVEKFTEITDLTCHGNLLASLDITKNTKLTVLAAWDNAILNIDLTKNELLTDLYLHNNGLTSIDLSKNVLLTDVLLGNNSLSAIDVSNNLEIETLSVHQNSLTELDVINNIKLTSLTCGNNDLTNLNVANNTLLEDLECSENQISNLDVSNNIRLKELNCTGNSITTLNLEANKFLIRLYCINNSLTELNLKNGFNSRLTILSCFGNNDLSCIQVDNVTYATNQGSWIKDSTANYSENCGVTAGVNEVFNDNIRVIDNPVKERLNIIATLGVTIKKVRVYNLLGQEVLTSNMTENIKISGLPKGMYLVKVIGENNNYALKKILKD